MNCSDRTSYGQRAILIVLTTAGWLTGCSTSAPEGVLTAETSRLKALSVLYGQCQSRNQNIPPKNEDEFKKFIEKSGQSMLRQFDVGMEELFISSRDDKPFVVFYGDDTPPSGVIAYEREGIGGERVVAYAFGAVETVGENRFRELVPNATE